MKHLYIMHLCTLMLMIGSSLGASSLTAYDNQTIYKTTNHVFSYNDIAQGFVRLNDGFTVMPNSCVTMDTVFSVSGGIDLRETSTIRLLKDLEFDSGVTLTTGGNIDGRGHTLILNGDFRVPAGKVLHFNGDTTIDAQGHEIVIGENAEIFVDTNVTLTIANAIIKTTRNAPTYPAVRCGAITSKLALNNVTLCPGNDFLFPQGQLFVHNDVMFTGTSAFIYHSPVPSFITQNSCLFFDHAVTFSVAPATFTDAPYTLKNTYTDCNFIKMADETSQLYLDGCTFQTTSTGLRISRGTVFCDDTVTIKTDPTLTLTSLSLRAIGGFGLIGAAVAWSPDGKYLAFGYVGKLNIYSFDGTELTLITQTNASPNFVQWSPDGKYIATDYGALRIYAFDGTSLTEKATANGALAASWSHDGKFLTTDTGSGLVLVYRFDGTKLSFITSGSGGTTDWSPDDKYLATITNFDLLRVYSFDGTNLTLVTTVAGIVSQASSRWTPDGRYLTMSDGATFIRIYRFDGYSLTFITTVAAASWLAQWSPDGRYIVIDDYTNGAVYSFNGFTLTLIPGSQINYGDDGLMSYHWRPDGKYLAAATYASGGASLFVYKVHYAQDTSPQASTKSLVLGDSAKGSDYDAHLRLLPGASINLNGKMLYDNVDGLTDWS